MSPVCLLFFRWMFVVSDKHLLFVRFSVHWSICVHYSFGNIRLIDPFYVCSLFVATGPCSLHVRSCVQSVSRIWRTGDFLHRIQYLIYGSIYADPVRLSVTLTGAWVPHPLVPWRYLLGGEGIWDETGLIKSFILMAFIYIYPILSQFTAPFYDLPGVSDLWNVAKVQHMKAARGCRL